MNINKIITTFKYTIVSITCLVFTTEDSLAIESYELFSNFKNSTLKSSTSQNFVEKKLLVGFNHSGYLAKSVNAKLIEKNFSFPTEFSEKEIITHYSNALIDNGFIITTHCEGLTCGSIASMTKALNTPAMLGYDETQNYRLYNLNNKLFVSIYTLGYEKEKLLNIQIIEAKDSINSELSINSNFLTSFIQKKGKAVLPNLHFEFDSDKITKNSKQTIVNLADYLKTVKNDKFYIVGHTDDLGSAEYNQKLSQQRAKSVIEALIKLGIKPEQLLGVGVGEYSPLFNNSNKLSREQNRRVELVKRSDYL